MHAVTWAVALAAVCGTLGLQAAPAAAAGCQDGEGVTVVVDPGALGGDPTGSASRRRRPDRSQIMRGRGTSWRSCRATLRLSARRPSRQWPRELCPVPTCGRLLGPLLDRGPGDGGPTQRSVSPRWRCQTAAPSAGAGRTRPPGPNRRSRGRPRRTPRRSRNRWRPARHRGRRRSAWLAALVVLALAGGRRGGRTTQEGMTIPLSPPAACSRATCTRWPGGSGRWGWLRLPPGRPTRGCSGWSSWWPR